MASVAGSRILLWYPVWLCYPAGILHLKQGRGRAVARVFPSYETDRRNGGKFDLLVLFTSTPGFDVDVRSRR